MFRPGNFEATEHWRPLFHFSAREGDLGDPNGLFFRDGRWHLHYQTSSPRSWGHASSPDLLHWEEHPLSLPAAPRDACWSGGVVDDVRNTSGLFAPGKGGLVALYTAHNPDLQGKPGEQSIALATSDDRGKSWTRYAPNHVLVGTTSNCRDPKAFWHEPTARWVMLLTEGHHLAFFASPNLRDWLPLSTLRLPRPPEVDAFECPDLFSLPVEGQPGMSKWVLTTSYLSGTNFAPQGFGLCEQQYFVGEFDGVAFHLEAGLAPPKRLGTGPDEYAALTWPRQASPARTLLIGWMGRWGYSGQGPTHPWKEHMTLPRELTLHAAGPDDWQLRQAPARELWAQNHTLVSVGPPPALVPAIGRHILGKTRCAALRVVLAPAENSVVEFQVFAAAHVRTRIGYDAARQILYFDRKNSGTPDFHPNFLCRYEAPLPPNGDGSLSLEIIIDHSAVEIFANGGAVYMSGNVFPDPQADEIAVQALSGATALMSLELRDFTT